MSPQVPLAPPPPVPLTPEEEWEIINTDTFDRDCRVRINAIRADLATNEAFADTAIETNVNGVYVRFQIDGQFVTVNCGKTTQGTYQVSLTIPAAWLENE